MTLFEEVVNKVAEHATTEHEHEALVFLAGAVLASLTENSDAFDHFAKRLSDTEEKMGEEALQNFTTRLSNEKAGL